MNSKNFILILLSLVLLDSCTIFTLHPIYHEEDLIWENQLIGTWEEEEKDLAIIQSDPTHEKMYHIVYVRFEEDGEISNPGYDSLIFKGGLVSLSNHYFMDLYPDYIEGYGFNDGDFLMRNYIPVHNLFKLGIKQDSLILYEVDGEKMKNLFDENKIRIRHEVTGDIILITASTDDIQKFIKRYFSDDFFFKDPWIFRRVIK